MLEQPLTLTTATLLSLLERHQAEPHPVLDEPPAWRGEQARRGARTRADAELSGLGLLGPRGVDAELMATVAAIGRPRLEYYGWINGGHRGRPLNYTLLAGRAGAETFVLAHNTEQRTVALAGAGPEGLLESLLAQLPALPPGRGRPLTVPRDRIAGAPEGTELRRLLGLPRLGGGSLYVAARDRNGRRERIDRPVTYLDTAEGRWLTELEPGREQAVVHCTPATGPLLAQRLRSAQAALPVGDTGEPVQSSVW